MIKDRSASIEKFPKKFLIYGMICWISRFVGDSGYSFQQNSCERIRKDGIFMSYCLNFQKIYKSTYLKSYYINFKTNLNFDLVLENEQKSGFWFCYGMASYSFDFERKIKSHWSSSSVIPFKILLYYSVGLKLIMNIFLLHQLVEVSLQLEWSCKGSGWF